jgi:hypothetical protein
MLRPKQIAMQVYPLTHSAVRRAVRSIVKICLITKETKIAMADNASKDWCTPMNIEARFVNV